MRPPVTRTPWRAAASGGQAVRCLEWRRRDSRRPAADSAHEGRSTLRQRSRIRAGGPSSRPNLLARARCGRPGDVRVRRTASVQHTPCSVAQRWRLRLGVVPCLATRSASASRLSARPRLVSSRAGRWPSGPPCTITGARPRSGADQRRRALLSTLPAVLTCGPVSRRASLQPRLVSSTTHRSVWESW